MKSESTRGRTFRRLGIGSAAVLSLGLIGCGASTPSQQLVNARQVYTTAASGPAAQVEPEHVLSARQALQRAEAAHADDAGSTKEKHLAYLAHRMSLLAMAKADVTLARQEKERADRRYTEVLALQKLEAERRLQQQEKSLDSADRQLAAANQARLDAEQQRQAAETRLATAEQRLRAALESLEMMSNVQMEARGLVITLSGAVLFEFGKAELLPIAKEKLRDVAKALKAEEDSGKTMIVEGHTDSVGSDQANLKLSQERAEAVRKFLVDEGLNANNIKAVGKGESQPLVPNDTVEQRANNRRVEIIIQDQQQQRQQNPQQQQQLEQ